MQRETIRKCNGFTLLEMMLSISMGLILLLVVGNLLVAGQNQWNDLYNYSTSKTRTDARNIYRVFGKIGRKSNRLSYALYTKDGNNFYPALPISNSNEEIVYGDAVEFRYWDVELDETDSHDLFNANKEATAYALFYIDDGVLKVDYGPFPPAVIPAGGGPRNSNGVRTRILAENVCYDEEMGAFSHTTSNGVGLGCVKIDIVLNDPEEDESINVQTATMMRNAWPR